MARPPNLTPLPKHPSIIEAPPVTRRMYNHQCPCVQVVCPHCEKTRWYPMNVLRQLLKEHKNFTGACRKCYREINPVKRKFRSIKNPSGRRVNSQGYIVITQNAISEEDMWMFDEMKKNNTTFEHRWNMAKHLGRPLFTYESVDHMDGNKSNNEVSNLRIYLRGKNQPGSLPGYGTYYHEWQVAEKEILRLKDILNTR